jgi:hypothetical protein
VTAPQLADHLRTLDLIQEEADHQPRFFKANYELYTPRLLAIAQALRAELATAREQALAEAEQIATTVIGPLWHLDTLHEITDRLRAARPSA